MIPVNNKRHGFTLLEVIVFITIFSTFFVSAAYVVTVFLRVSRYNQDKILASHYATEASEWLQGEKEQDWSIFSGNRASIDGKTWCLNDTPIVWPTAAGPCSADTEYQLIGNFKREVKLTTNSASTPTQVKVEIIVFWKEGDKIYNSPITNIFSIFE